MLKFTTSSNILYNQNKSTFRYHAILNLAPVYARSKFSYHEIGEYLGQEEKKRRMEGLGWLDKLHYCFW